jgi:hypothetical protein
MSMASNRYLCQAQVKLGWPAGSLSLTIKLFLPFKMFTKKCKKMMASSILKLYGFPLSSSVLKIIQDIFH